MFEEIFTGKPKVRIRAWNFLLVWLALIRPASGQNYTFHLVEESTPPREVGKISGTPDFVFFGSHPGFAIDSRLGIISASTKFDRDTDANPVRNLRVRTGNKEEVSVQVVITDINDNAPTFNKRVLVVQISENADKDSDFPLDTASDQDAGLNGTIEYSIAPGNGTDKFKLGVFGECSRSDLCLITKEKLDRERRAFYQLKIIASDKGTPPLQGHCLVNITILDYNDKAPVFSQNLYNGSIAENSNVGASVVTVKAGDLDEGVNAEVRYSLESSGVPFKMDPVSGLITSDSTLDHESKHFYSFEVVAQDSGSPPLKGKSKVDVYVQDVNEFRPEITVSFLSSTFLENVHQHRVAIFFVKDQDTSQTVNVTISSGNELGHFVVKEVLPNQLWQLNSVGLLDREKVSRYNLTIEASDDGRPSLSTFESFIVSLEDVNDNSPTFGRPQFFVSVSELEQPGSFVIHMNASDSDLGSNSVISYSLLQSDLNWFRIDPSSGIVTTAASLDRETHSEVLLTIIAEDHGSPSRNGSTLLNVTLLDGNDFSPDFGERVYNASLAEGEDAGSLIIKLTATDRDIDDNGRVTYEIDSSIQEITDSFAIDLNTGKLTNKVVLDREKKDFYDIEIIAKDHGKPQHSSRTNVHLTVTDVNDNRPIYYPVVYYRTLPKGARPQEILTVSATDVDLGQNGRVLYDIAAGNDEQMFAIDQSTGKIRSVKNLTTAKSYLLNLTVKDGGGLTAKRNAAAHVTVLDNQDNPPVFKHAMYNYSVYENVPWGTLVGRVVATTNDSNSQIGYSIVSGDPGHLFAMDSAGGIIKVDGSVDREEEDLYHLGVVAQVASLSATALVNVVILDENDNIPKFPKSSLEVIVSGNLPVGSMVSNAQAVDMDAGLNGIVKYQLIDDGNGHFTINTTSGVVRLSSPIIGLDGSRYLLKIRASDLGLPPRHALLTLTVNIFTNHPPRFTEPSHTVPVSSNLPLGKQFHVVVAIDNDQGDNGVIQYSIAPDGNVEGLFGIFADGSLYVKKALSQATQSIYDITIIAEDKGSPPLNATATVNIIIQDSTEHRKLFSNSTYRFSIPESPLPGKQVGFLKASASDPVKTMGIVYSFVSNQKNFVVDPKTGEITTIRMLDREAVIASTGSAELIMQAEAVYNDTKVTRDTAIVVVQILDVNDNSPAFSRQLYQTSVMEDSVPGTVVFQLSAVDPDSNAEVVYSVTGGSGSSKFAINTTNGVILLEEKLDRELVDVYDLKIRATDAQDTSRSSETLLEIRVGDANDNKPSFGDDASFVVSVSESLPVTSVVTVMNATDKDLDINAELVYGISSGNLEGVFGIDRSTGAIILAKTLDYEMKKEYKMNVTVTDQGDPVLFARTELVVMVTDANDNRPVFVDQLGVLRVPESVAENHVIGSCRAVDDDSGMNGKIVYSIQSQVPDVKAFGIHPDNCTLYTLRKLDREVVSNYKILVQATDQALPVLSRLAATKEISVQVEDANDNKPRFVSPLAAPVPASISAGSSVMTVSAEDPDQGSNGQVAYTISSAAFELVPGTGELKTKLPLNNLIYTVPVTAKDKGTTPQSKTQNVIVFNQGSGGPTFTLSRYTDSVVENSPIGQSLVTVQAAYSPPKPGANVEYFVTSDNSKRTFGVDRSTGVVRILNQVDYESPLGSVFTLKIFAVDSSGPAPHTSSAEVEITVTDANDNRPEFTAVEYRATVAENSAAGVVVTSALSASDKDSGENKRITFRITGGNEGSWFTIDPSSGVISTTATTLDRETQPVHHLNITAEDHGSPSLSSVCTVRVVVQDVNDNAPQFTQLFYAFGVYEDADIGARVGAVSAVDIDVGANAVVAYHFPSSDVFTIDPSTGVIRLTGNLDRETNQLYIFNVSASDGGPSSSFVSVYISILDRNDNAPTFTASEYSANIAENAAVNSPVLTVSVTDPDHGSNADISYNIVSGNNGGVFSILPNGTVLNSKLLDREKRSSYLLEVTATDQAQPLSARLSRTAFVRITVTDVNDNTPLFASKNIAHVSEDAQPGDVVTTVLVVDFDAGSNSDIVFGLRKVDLSAPFSLGSWDGILRVSGKLDRENRDRYSVEVTATDQGNPSRSSKSTITIIVDDFNDHAPVFQPHDSVVKIRENTAVLTEILDVSATDSDLGANAEVRFDITSGNTAGAFSINPISGSLEVAKPLDRERTANYSLDVRAYDLGVPRQSTVTTVSVELLDVNDNPPKFEQPEYRASVLENYPVKGIITVVAKDPDVGANGQITYEIIRGDSDGAFAINPSSGVISLKKKLDRETQETYTLWIKATDKGEGKLSDQAKLVITVRDENDNSPTFYPNKLKASVLEKKPSGTQVVRVSAVDRDDNGARGLVYSLDSAAPEFALFKIDPSSGVIVTQTSLDHERESRYKLTVYATDRGNPGRRGTATVDVTVEDVNDNDPKFDEDQYDVTVEEGVSSGAIVFAVSAADDDSMENALSSYSITNNSFFGISPETGIVTALKKVTSNGSPFSFTVKAINQAAPYHEDSARLRLQVTQGPFPHFRHPAQSIAVSELAPVGSKILKLNATGHTKYQIAAGNTMDKFDVDVEGNLKVKNTLDYGLQNKYDLVVEAMDGSNPPKAGYVSVTISVIDKNNNPPIFSKTYYQATVKEGQPSNQTVIRVSATDADAGSNAETRYSIVKQGSGYADFGISPKTGRLFTAVKLNRESASSYRLKVRAENVIDPSLWGEATVHVIVRDVNDNAPVFEGAMSVSVLETATVGSDVISLTAIDEDEGPNAMLTYGFAGNPGGFFSISPDGKITLAKDVDHENTTVVLLQVTASDSVHVTSANLTVSILDVNDNPPEFLATPYIGHVDERSPEGTPVMNVSAFDADTGSFAENVYSILPSAHSDLFAIERKSGVLKLAQMLVYQRSSIQPNPNTYKLTVMARNVWSPFFEQTVPVVVQVDDINDHAPKFSSTEYFFFVTKGSPRDTLAGEVTAVDEEDDGDNAVVRYSLAGGNGTSLFSVSVDEGKIRTASNLQAPGLFHLKVIAKDLGVPNKENSTNVFVDVTEVNAASPRFSTLFYTFVAAEDLPLGSFIDRVTAGDSDSGSNGQITYAITSGNDAGNFGIGRKNGSIYTTKSLDFESETTYYLNVTATDGGRPPRTSSATAFIKLSDVNDNPPSFSSQVYQLKIMEGAQVGTAVGKVSATDQDKLGPVTYGIEPVAMERFFGIGANTGLLSNKVVFDYETRNSYELVVVADDAKFSSRAQVRVAVVGANEFSPTFDRAVYDVAIAENAPPGSSVTTLTATDQDKGPDGELVYLLVDSHDSGFSLDPRTGVLSVSGSLDSEKRGVVRLEALVKNLYEDIVTPDNSDLVSVVVTVTDANDVPRFLQSQYKARIPENARLQTVVANVTAVDDDARQFFNAELVYGITQGNEGSTFRIDSATGIIRTAGRLDRERRPQYRLTVSATDDGLPPLSGYATVVVDLDDINDNPPILVNCTGHVRENQPSGSSVTDLQPTDLDISPNQGPFRFAITLSNSQRFRIDSSTGKVTTTAQLDREVRDQYDLSINITDNGVPQRSAISYCLVIVDDENDNPPLDTSRLVHMTSFDRSFGGGPVGNVQPEDVDLVNSMTCGILSSSAGSPAFTFPAGKCELQAPAYRDGGEFTLKVQGSDGRAAVDYDVVVKFLPYTGVSLNQSVALRLRDASPERFLQNSYQSLLSAVNSVVPPGYSAQLLSVTSVGEGFVNVVVAVQRDNSFTYLDRDKVVQLLRSEKSQLESAGKVVIADPDYTACTADMCQNQAECTSFMKPSGFSTKIETIPVIFHSVNYTWHYSCLCKRGYTGRHCESISDPCSKNVCKNQADCENIPGGYRCNCKPGFTGKNCETAIDYCTSSPCKFNSSCSSVQGSFHCQCDFGGRGKRCERPSLGFDPVSYMMLPTLTSRENNNITLQFATSQQQALLFYNADGQYKKDSDFIALEIIGGKLRFSFNLGEVPVVINSLKNVADGRWHTVVAVRNQKRGELVVDGGVKVSSTSQGELKQLNLNLSPLFIGGVKDFQQILNHPAGHITAYDFSGCMRDLYVDGKAIGRSDATELQAVANSCPRDSNCASQPCQNRGTCVDEWFDYICECKDGYMGRNCEKELNPFTFSGGSYVVLDFKEDYRRKQAVEEKSKRTARRRRAVGSDGTTEQFSLKFRTREGGLILLAEDAASNYTVLEVKSGGVYYSFKISATDELSITDIDVTDGEWHSVSLKHHENNVEMTVDDKQVSEDFSVRPHNFLGSNIMRWSLGGVTAPPAGVSLEKFKGCMEDLSIDGIRLSLEGPNRFANLVAVGDQIGEGCPGANLCATNPCKDFSEKPYCFLEWEKYTCISDAPCKPNRCEHNGTCLPQKDGSFKCRCHTNFTGELCEIVPACRHSPCPDGEVCEGVGSSGYQCRSASSDSRGLSAGIIAAIVFFVFLIIIFIIVIFVVHRHRMNQRLSKAARDFECVEPATDAQDASQRTSPSHSSDDSGVEIKNPSQKSLMDLQSSTKDHGKGVVIHNVGAPENYQIKLTKSNEKIDHGFSESDGEFMMRNKYNSERRAVTGSKAHRTQPHRSTPISLDHIGQRTTNYRPGKARKLPNPHFKHGRQQQLARAVLDPRRRPQNQVIQNAHAQRPPAGSLSSDEMQDFTDTGHCSDFENNSEMIEHYDIDVASIGFSEISYQYDPNQFKDPTIHGELPGMSPAEIERLRRHAPSGSMLDAVSLATSDNGGPAFDKLSSILEPPDSTSESSDDTFTCSEFDCEENEEVKVVVPARRLSREEQNRASMVFSELPQRDNKGYQSDENSPRASLSSVSDEELVPQTINGSTELFNWDDLLNWGLRYHNLRGVYKDIAQLKDTGIPRSGEYEV